MYLIRYLKQKRCSPWSDVAAQWLYDHSKTIITNNQPDLLEVIQLFQLQAAEQNW